MRQIICPWIHVYYTHDSHSKLVSARTKSVYDLDGSKCNTCTLMFHDLCQPNILSKFKNCKLGL